MLLLLALAGVALLYLVVYRGWRYPFMTVAALLVGTEFIALAAFLTRAASSRAPARA